MTRESLKDRYNNKVLGLAEERRQKFHFVSIDLNINRDDRLSHVNRLVYETHQAYYFAHNSTVCTNCGVILEQSLIYLLDKLGREQGYLSAYVDNSVVDITTDDELSSLGLNILISSAKYFRLFSSYQSYNIAKQMQSLRNGFIHNVPPTFNLIAGNYCSSFNGVDIIISEDEVEQNLISNDNSDLWAYYMLKEIRSFLALQFPNDDYDLLKLKTSIKGLNKHENDKTRV